MTALPELQTRRLHLRPFQPADAELLHALWTDPYVRRYLWDDRIISRETVDEVLASHPDTVIRAGIGYWVITLQATGQPAGFCGLRFIDETTDVELMYGCLQEYSGQGIVTEAVRATLNYAWKTTPFQRIWARTDPPNERSVALMQRLGMTRHSATPALISYFIDRPERPSFS